MTDTPPTIKCLIWDLDNTLWTGTLLEGDRLDLAEHVRDVLRELDSRGILHAVSSKNDHDPAWQQLQELGVADFFVAARIGWTPKSDAVREIAEELGFAHTAIGFIDDQPAERAEVSFHLPQVRCYGPEQIAELTALPEFTPRTVTQDSQRRRQMYRAGVRRTTARAEFQGPDDEFLRSLELRMTIAAADEVDVARVEELTLRTSQMNATGVHYSDQTLRDLLVDPTHDVLVTTLSDRFGPHGAVGIVLLHRPAAEAWHLKLLATSCRVVSFGVGAVLLNWLSDAAARAGAHLVADFRATDRNRMMEVAYRFAGFEDTSCPCLTRLRPPTTPDIQRLHLEPTRRSALATLTLTAPELAPGTLMASEF